MSQQLAVLLSVGILLLAAPVVGADARLYERCEISAIDWDVMPRSPYSPNTVRKAQYLLVLRNPNQIEAFVQWLSLDRLKSRKRKNGNPDVRLVIDLITADGSRITYVADRFALYSEDYTLRRSIDESFRKQFVFLPSVPREPYR